MPHLVNVIPAPDHRPRQIMLTTERLETSCEMRIVLMKQDQAAGCGLSNNMKGGRKGSNAGTAGCEPIRRPDPASTPSTHGSQSNVSDDNVDHRCQTIG
jgi:hypothetical protein